MTSSYVEVRGVVRRFGNVVAVDRADLEVERGELVALLGPSGCGKTTLLRVIGGLETPQAGSVTVDGTMIEGPGVSVPPERRRIGLVFQDYALFPHLDVESNVAFGLPRGVDRRRRTAELLELVGLPGLQKRMPHELSGGQQQRVALARAVAPEPRLLLLDEPFSNLDPSIRERVRGEVRDMIRAVGITAVFVTHDQDEALSLASRVAVMDHGVILQTGAPRDVYGHPVDRRVAEFIGRPNFLPGKAGGGAVTCELGTLPLVAPVEGTVDVMVRSEDVTRVEEGGVSATIVEVQYFGHEESVLLRLGSGSLVRARWRAAGPLSVGETVHISVCGPVHAYPRG